MKNFNAMPEILLLCFLMIPQIVAGVYAHSIGKSFWFWFFISFLIPIISLVVLLMIDNKKPKEANEEKKGYQLADMLGKDGKKKSPRFSLGLKYWLKDLRNCMKTYEVLKTS